jgi:hypothetical protein
VKKKHEIINAENIKDDMVLQDNVFPRQVLRAFNYGDSVFPFSCKGFILPALPEIVHTLT